MTDPRQRPSYADAAEIGSLLDGLARFERGELDADRWRAQRVAQGTYSQRQDGVHMLRIKVPQGVATADQLRALADVARRFSRGFGHVTSRQNFQIHFVKPADLAAALNVLAAAGLTTSGAGGNTVRNVTACPHAGVSPDEIFDPTAYAEAVTRHLLRHPLGDALPRKLKIAFEGCAADHAHTAIQDLGLRARLEGGRRGFSVVVAGGTSTLCTSASPLLPFLPAGDVLALAEALVRLFHARGDRQNKARNRIKFLVRALGLDAFRAELLAELDRVRAEGAPRLPFDPERPAEEPPPAHARPPAPAPAELAARVLADPPRGPGLAPPVAPAVALDPALRAGLLRLNVRAQRQDGFHTVTAAAPQGDLTAAQLDAIADLALALGDGTARLAPDGQVHLRWVRTADVLPLLERLAAAGLARRAGSADDIVSCPGAEVCRLAVTQSRGVARLAEEHLRAALPASALDAPFPVHVSGCPNGCSRHHLAAVGLQGGVRRVGNVVAPGYVLLVGGGVGDAGARFGRPAAKVPARRVPEALARLVTLWREEADPGESAGDFLARAFDRAQAVLAPLEGFAGGAPSADDLVDPGATGPFRPDVQEGECAA